MAKAADLNIDLTAAMHQPPAATAPRSIKESGRESQPPKHGTSVNFRAKPELRKRIRILLSKTKDPLSLPSPTPSHSRRELPYTCDSVKRIEHA